jgi:hypothetical protein
MDRKLLIDFIERMLLASEFEYCSPIRPSSLYRRPSHRGKGAEMMGRPLANERPLGFLLELKNHSRTFHVRLLCFMALRKHLSSSLGLIPWVLSSPPSKCTVGISANLTEGAERPLRVLIDELDDNIDLAGVNLEAVDEIEPERSRKWPQFLCCTCPRTAI